MEHICPEILIISNQYDFSTDHVVYQLYIKGVPYLRLNRDQFSNFKITFFPTEPLVYGETEDFTFEIRPNVLKAIYFRAPTFLRDIYQPDLSTEEQLQRSQWTAFVRSLIVFENILWVNHPVATYKAEVKPYQLYIAKQIGFDIPKTVIANYYADFIQKDKLAIKTIEPAILRVGRNEAFIYTNIVSTQEIKNAYLRSAPIIIQEALVPKIDIRVTVIGEKVFAVSILKGERGINIDWRLEKNNVNYKPIKLKDNLEEMCIKLVKKLNLNFGAIDLCYCKGNYYFLEINPTGEWAWLLEPTGYNIDEVIANLLINRNV